MKFRHKRREEEESEINITPMMDIVFIMLIFFIVTTSFIKETGIDPNRPEAETAKRAELGNILIAVAPNDRIWMNKAPIELEAVKIMMELAYAENPESSVVIVADELEKAAQEEAEGYLGKQYLLMMKIVTFRVTF